MVSFLDTSVVLNHNFNEFENPYISPLVLMELEGIKNSNKPEFVKYRAREAIRSILSNPNIMTQAVSQRDIDKLLQKHKFLMDIADHRLLCEALIIAREFRVCFYTSDGALALFARKFNEFKSEYLPMDTAQKEVEYCGWRDFYPTDEQLVSLYSNPNDNVLAAKVNEYCKIWVENEMKDVLVWTGEKYRNLNYKDIKNKFLGTTFRPRNLEQKLAFDLLQNPQTPVKLLTGTFGAGKDLLMLIHALDLIQQGKKDKIIFVRNLIPFKDAPEIGFLSGDLDSKIRWGLGPIASILGEEGLLQYEEEGLIKAVNLGFIRGEQYNRSIIYVTEGQNITGGGYKLLISRCGEESEIWINGDIKQVDEKKFEENNGLTRLINSLNNDPLFGMVKLIKSERSPVAELAAKIK